jgi:hypothetical protein
MTEMYVWSMFKGYLAGFYTYPVATPSTVNVFSRSQGFAWRGVIY